jgi:CBS domain-containing protein
MSCSDAIINLENVVTIKPDTTVGAAMDLLDQKNLRAMPVVDEKNVYVGMFGTRILLRRLLPTSGAVQSGSGSLHFAHGSSLSIVEHLLEIKNQPVADHMDSKVKPLHPEAPTWEAIRLLSERESPLPVVSKENGVLLGIISDQSILSFLKEKAEQVSE